MLSNLDENYILNTAFYFSQPVVTASFTVVFMDYLWLIRLPYLVYNVALEKFNTTKKLSRSLKISFLSCCFSLIPDEYCVNKIFPATRQKSKYFSRVIQM